VEFICNHSSLGIINVDLLFICVCVLNLRLNGTFLSFPMVQLGFWCLGWLNTLSAPNKNYELETSQLFTEFPFICLSSLTLSLQMSYTYTVCGAPCKTRNFNVIYIWTYVWQRWKLYLSICCTIFQHWINAESYPVAQLCVDTLPATKVNLITDEI
jgi:hypothetical protein